MQVIFAAAALAIAALALRDEFREGGSLHLQLRRARQEAAPVAAERDEVVIVSPNGIEIPVGTLTAAEIVDYLAELDRYGAAV